MRMNIDVVGFPTPNAADPPVAEGEGGGLSQLGSGQQSSKVKLGGSADLIVGWLESPA